MENKEDNDLFFLCSLIEYIARKTKNTKKTVVEKLGKKNIQKIYDLADIYHSENIEKVSDEFIESTNIQEGDYDIISKCQYRAPSFWEIAKVYRRLIMMVNPDRNEYVETTIEVLSSWIVPHIDNYNSSMYYENPSYIYACYTEKEIL